MSSADAVHTSSSAFIKSSFSWAFLRSSASVTSSPLNFFFCSSISTFSVAIICCASEPLASAPSSTGISASLLVASSACACRVLISLAWSAVRFSSTMILACSTSTFSLSLPSVSESRGGGRSMLRRMRLSRVVTARPASASFSLALMTIVVDRRRDTFAGRESGVCIRVRADTASVPPRPATE